MSDNDSPVSSSSTGRHAVACRKNQRVQRRVPKFSFRAGAKHDGWQSHFVKRQSPMDGNGGGVSRISANFAKIIASERWPAWSRDNGVPRSQSTVAVTIVQLPAMIKADFDVVLFHRDLHFRRAGTPQVAHKPRGISGLIGRCRTKKKKKKKRRKKTKRKRKEKQRRGKRKARERKKEEKKWNDRKRQRGRGWQRKLDRRNCTISRAPTMEYRGRSLWFKSMFVILDGTLLL